jgi:Predicted enzyme with a TIM-barrel fold
LPLLVVSASSCHHIITKSDTTTTTQRNMSSSSDNTTKSSNEAADDSIIAANIASVKSHILETLQECNRSPDSVRLVAVSKTKPVEMLMEAYHAGQRHFGENYAQELIHKAEEMPSDIKWHFIGPLQSNKAGPLVKSLGLKKLVCVETVSTIKLALKLNHAAGVWLEQQQEQKEEGQQEGDIVVLGGENEKKLGIYIQVNTSGEETKSGVSDEKECVDLAKEIAASCPNLRIDGLMTIGAPGDFSCFDLLVECRKSVAEVLSVNVDNLELSMGMSGDYVEAIQRGATSVRVGSTIFGARDYSSKK